MNDAAGQSIWQSFTCQNCLGSGWLYEKDFKEQIKHYDRNNLEVIEAYENGPSKEIPVL